eukprot:m.1253535 g.1253535  ORF g.1253535 m.1253535 type:complete len:419 (+) comp24705_c0_seq7:184-1440(+)
MDSMILSHHGPGIQERFSSDDVEISWRLDSRAAKRIRLELGLKPISWCETPSPDGESYGIAISSPLPSTGDSSAVWESTNATKATRAKPSRRNCITMQQERPEPWSSLSHELYLHIFRFLDASDLASCARVCSLWRQVVYDDSLWRSIDILQKRIPPSLVFFAIQRNPRWLSIVNCDMIDFEDGEGDIEVLSNQERDSISCTRLDLSSTRIHDQDVIRLLKMSPHLKVLDLGNTTITDKTLFAVAEFCPNLDSLSLRMVSGITERGVEAVLRSCTKLRVLSLGWATTNSKRFAQYIAKHCVNIEHLDLSGCCYDVSDRLVREITEASRKLQTLDLSDCYDLTDNCIDSIVKNLRNITTVSLSRNHLITLDAMWKLTSARTLRNINLFGCYPNVFPELKSKCRHLQVNEQALTCLPPFM